MLHHVGMSWIISSNREIASSNVAPCHKKQQIPDKVASTTQFNSSHSGSKYSSKQQTSNISDQSIKKYISSNKLGFVPKNKINKHLTINEKFKIISSLGENMDVMCLTTPTNKYMNAINELNTEIAGSGKRIGGSEDPTVMIKLVYEA